MDKEQFKSLSTFLSSEQLIRPHVNADNKIAGKVQCKSVLTLIEVLEEEIDSLPSTL